jgi:hypothetical protein
LEKASGDTIGYLKPYKDRKMLRNKELWIVRRTLKDSTTVRDEDVINTRLVFAITRTERWSRGGCATRRVREAQPVGPLHKAAAVAN